MKELFTIGEMAELFQINIRTLRYYDDIGLLRPETVNPETGYRYYSTKQFERLNTIKYLRTLNMPLEKMKQFFQNRDARVMEQILEDQLFTTREQLAQLQKTYPNLKEGDFALTGEHSEEIEGVFSRASYALVQFLEGMMQQKAAQD